MRMRLKTKAIIFTGCIVIAASVIGMIGASLLSAYQTRQANHDRLQKALESLQRQFHQQLADIETTYHQFVNHPQNNYFLHSSIRMKYFLWQDNPSLLNLRRLLHLDGLAFYYPSETEAKTGGDRLRMFEQAGEKFIYINEQNVQTAIHVNEFSVPVSTPLSYPIAPQFSEIYVPAPRFALKIRDQQLLLIAHFEVNRLIGDKPAGPHIGYFVLERAITLDVPVMDRELGVNLMIYDQDGHPGHGAIAAPPLNLTTQTFSAEHLVEIMDTAQQRYDALIDAIRYDGVTVGYLSVSIAQAETTRKIQATLALLSLLGLAILCPILIVVWMGVTKFTQPIITLTRISTEMARGNLAHPIETHNRDEIGVLAGSFAYMRDQIRQKIVELQQLNAELDQRVKDRTAEIARQKYILDTFMANVPDSIYFKDRESRIIRTNVAHARSFGVSGPDDLIGKTDFDFFGEEQARPKYEQEQEIIRTGQPLLAVEEPDAGGRWALTTKMPLEDETGAIIGTFGISRDITPLKQAQQALELHAQELAAAYQEIQILNEQLKDDNVRMHAEMDLARRIQTALLPQAVMHLHPDFEIAAVMLPAEEVGGDYYDVTLDQDGAIWFGIGDVSGHGVTPGLIMMMAQTVHTTITTNYQVSPCEIVVMINKVLYKNVHDRLRAEHFMTFTTLKYLENGRFQYAGAHLDFVVYRHRTHTCELIDTTGVWLNFIEDISQSTQNDEFSLEVGDILVLYTDGLTEAWNDHRQMLDIHRFTAIVQTHAAKPVEAMRDAILADALAWCNRKQTDDMSLVVVRRVR